MFTRNDVAVLNVEVVVRPEDVAGDDRGEGGAVLKRNTMILILIQYRYVEKLSSSQAEPGQTIKSAVA